MLVWVSCMCGRGRVGPWSLIDVALIMCGKLVHDWGINYMSFFQAAPGCLRIASTVM